MTPPWVSATSRCVPGLRAGLSRQHEAPGTAQSSGTELYPGPSQGTPVAVLGGSSRRPGQKDRSGVFHVMSVTSCVPFPCRTHRHAAGAARGNTGNGEQSPSARSRHRQQAKSSQHTSTAASMANGTATSMANGIATGTATSTANGMATGMANGVANGTGDPALVRGGGRAWGYYSFRKLISAEIMHLVVPGNFVPVD